MKRNIGRVAATVCIAILAVAVSSFAATGTVTLNLGGSDGYVLLTGDATKYYDGDSFTREEGTKVTYTPYDSTGKIKAAAGTYTVVAGNQTLTVAYCQMGFDLAGTGGSAKLTQTGEVFTEGQTKWLPMGARISYIVYDSTGKIVGSEYRKTVDCTDLVGEYCEMGFDLGGTGGSVKLTQSGEVFTEGQTKWVPMGARVSYIAYDATGKIPGPEYRKTVDCSNLVAEYCDMEIVADTYGSVTLSQTGEVFTTPSVKWVPMGARVSYIFRDEMYKILVYGTKVADCTALLPTGYCLTEFDMISGGGTGNETVKLLQTGQVFSHGQTKYLRLGRKISYVAFDASGTVMGPATVKTVDCTPVVPEFCEMEVELPDYEGNFSQYFLVLLTPLMPLFDGDTVVLPVGARVSYIAVYLTPLDGEGQIFTPALVKTVDCTPLEPEMCEMTVDLPGNAYVIIAETGEVLFNEDSMLLPVGARFSYFAFDETGQVRTSSKVKVVDCTPLEPEYCDMEIDLGGREGSIKILETGNTYGDEETVSLPLGVTISYVYLDEYGNVAGRVSTKKVDCTPLQPFPAL